MTNAMIYIHRPNLSVSSDHFELFVRNPTLVSSLSCYCTGSYSGHLLGEWVLHVLVSRESKDCISISRSIRMPVCAFHMYTITHKRLGTL